jgi:hypothetical protein
MAASNEKTPSKPVYPSSQKPPHASSGVHLSGKTNCIIPQNPRMALQLFYGEMDLPVQALSLYLIPEYEYKRRASAKIIH